MPSTTLDRPRLVAAPASTEGRSGARARRLGHPSVFLFTILAAQLMVVLDTTVVNVALPHIQGGLGLSSTAMSWVINAYILTFGGFLLLGARAGDLIGRRKAFLIGIALFSASSLMGGLAATGWMLLLARALQGMGAALAAPSALSLLTAVYPEGPQRVRAIALYTTVSAAGGAIGLVAGGLLTELASWRWVMFVNVPIGVLVWILGRVVVGETERRKGRFDVLGALTSTLGMTGVVLGLVEAGSEGWGAPLTIPSFVGGVTLLGAFVLNEKRAQEPILPLRLLANATRSTANAARGLVYAGMYGMFFFMSQFLQDVQRYSPLRAGVAFLPMPAAVFLSSQFASRVLVRRLPQKIVMMSGITLAALGLLVATQVQTGTGYSGIVLSLLLLGAGSGISFVSLTSASLADVEPADAGAASGLINVSQQIGAAFGLAVLVTSFDIVTHHAQIGARIPRGALGAANALFVHGLHDAFAIGVAFTLAALLIVGTLIRLAPDTRTAAESSEAKGESEMSWVVERGEVAQAS